MNQMTRDEDAGSSEFDFGQLRQDLKTGWKWIVAGLLAGTAVAGIHLAMTPSQYEATALLQPATIALVSVPVTPAASTSVELVPQTVERLKLVTFYPEEIVSACGTKSAKDLVDQMNAGVVRANTLLSVSFRATSIELAKSCLGLIVEHLKKSQQQIGAPLLAELEAQRLETKKQIDEIERMFRSDDKLTLSSPERTLLAAMKRDDLMILQKLYREQSIQLTAPLTQPMKLLGPIYTPERAVYPKKLLTLVGGMAIGLFLGFVVFFLTRGKRRNDA